jgi:hypothetical protein
MLFNSSLLSSSRGAETDVGDMPPPLPSPLALSLSELETYWCDIQQYKKIKTTVVVMEMQQSNIEMTDLGLSS